MKVWILSKGKSGVKPESKLFGIGFGSMEKKLRGRVYGD
jgi:hypothetical protein